MSACTVLIIAVSAQGLSAQAVLVPAAGGLFGSNGFSGAFLSAVRPVVYLQSGVTVDDLSISSSGTEENWTTTLPDIFPSERLEYGQITE